MVIGNWIMKSWGLANVYSEKLIRILIYYEDVTFLLRTTQIIIENFENLFCVRSFYEVVHTGNLDPSKMIQSRKRPNVDSKE